MLKLQALEFLGDGHQNEQIQGDRLAGGHFLSSVAQRGRQVQDNVLKSVITVRHRYLLARLLCATSSMGGLPWRLQLHDCCNDQQRFAGNLRV
jgi:hypothetical protein